MDKTIAEMIEDSGEMWARVRSRVDSPVLITKSMCANFPVWELNLEEGANHPYWTVRERALTDIESGELTQAYHARDIDDVGSIVGAVSDGTNYMTRAYIKNGRAPMERGWTRSIEPVKVTIEKLERAPNRCGGAKDDLQ